MFFRQWLCPTSKTLYENYVNPSQPIKEFRPDHNYSRPWIEDPNICPSLPVIELFKVDDENELTIDVERVPCSEENIQWAPTTNAVIPRRFECVENGDVLLEENKKELVEKVVDFLDQIRLAALCCESISNVVYWRLATHRVVFKFNLFLDEFPKFLDSVEWLHQHVCRNFDRISIGHYVDLFQLLYNENPKIRSAFEKIDKSWPGESLERYVYDQIIEKTSDLTEEVIFSLALPNFPVPTVCLIIPGVSFDYHLKRVEFWQKNLSQLSTVLTSMPIDHQEIQVQQAYDDVLKKFHEIRQTHPNHKILFLGWNVGSILALKAALLCPVATVVCLSLPFEALSEETKNDLTKINSSILFIEAKNQSCEKLDRYRRRLKSRNSLIRLESCDNQLRMTEQGKSRFRLTQQTIEKFLMEQIVDFVNVLSPRPTKTNDSIDEQEIEAKKKRTERSQTVPNLTQDEGEEIFLYSGENSNPTSLTINPEQDPNTIFLNTTIQSSTTSRKRKTTNNETTRTTTNKRGRQKSKDPKQPTKTNSKKSKASMMPTATTSILNALLQLPTNQPKSRTTENNLSKSFN